MLAYVAAHAVGPDRDEAERRAGASVFGRCVGVVGHRLPLADQGLVATEFMTTMVAVPWL